MKTAITLAFVGASLLSGVANAQTPQYLFDVTGKSPYKQAYQDMLAFPEWVRTGQGTSTPLQEVVIDGQKYTLGQMCKPHDCADNQLIVIFSPDKKKPGACWPRDRLMVSRSIHSSWVRLRRPSRSI